MSLLSALFFGILRGIVIGLLICVQLGGCYVVFLFLRDQFRRR